MVKTVSLQVSIVCPCGAKATVREGKSFYALCPGCGRKTFFKNPLLLERVRLGGALCPHHPEPKPCQGGATTWCPLCRVRTFSYDQVGP